MARQMPREVLKEVQIRCVDSNICFRVCLFRVSQQLPSKFLSILFLYLEEPSVPDDRSSSLINQSCMLPLNYLILVYEAETSDLLA